jgi:hypothetical protein
MKLSTRVVREPDSPSCSCCHDWVEHLRAKPGMDGPVYAGVRDPYDVLLIARDGSAQVFQSYR